MRTPFVRYASGLRYAAGAALMVLLAACGGGKSDAEAAQTGADDAVAATLAAKEAASAINVGGLKFSPRACAKEGGQCIFSGEQVVAYGADGHYVMKKAVDGTACNNTMFGDPMVGTVKHCFLSLTLVAGAGSGASSPAPTLAPVPVTPVATATSPVFDATKKPSKTEASRLLIQATFGASPTEIDKLSSMTYADWLGQQFATAPMDSYWAYIHRGGPIGCDPCTSQHVNAVMEAFWMQAVQGSDQVRQRVALALSELFVISTVNSSIDVDPAAHAGYFDMLNNNAFGNFRTLLEQVATHPAMGAYLSHLQNEKEDPATGRLPDENFAREVMQLFTIGLWELNDDGTRKKDASGADIPTYSQADVMGLAKVFTGLSWGNGDWAGGLSNANPLMPYERVYNQQMIFYPAHHSTSEKRIVRGVVIPANTAGPQSLKIALDTLFNHPNLGPFFGTQLIKRLVTSNPSPAYIKRVSSIFADNGSGVRGDMKAVIRAVLFDPEARDAAKITDPTWGKLREPMIRYANFMRAFNVTPKGGVYMIWNLEDTLASVGQNPLRAPSVFNWFRPDYSPPGALPTRGLVAPEFQITHETTTTGYANFMAGAAERQNTWYRDNVAAKYGIGPEYLAADYSPEMALARTDVNALVDRINLVLMAGQMSNATRKVISDAVSATPADSDSGMRRAAYAIYLTMQSPEYIVQK